MRYQLINYLVKLRFEMQVDVWNKVKNVNIDINKLFKIVDFFNNK